MRLRYTEEPTPSAGYSQRENARQSRNGRKSVRHYVHRAAKDLGQTSLRRAIKVQMGKRDIVVIGTSAGGVEALQELVQHLPADYPGAIFVVMHIGPGSILPEILSRAGKIQALPAAHNTRYQRNRIYVAPPNR